jgi:hypothetical protein
MVNLFERAITKLVSLLSLVSFHTFARAIMMIKNIKGLNQDQEARESGNWRPC